MYLLRMRFSGTFEGKKMRKAMIAAVAALAGMSTNTYAADLKGGSYKDEPVAYESTKTWTGLYIGGGIGVGASVTDLTVKQYERAYKEYSEVSRSVEGAEYDKVGSAGIDGLGGEGAFGTVQLGYDRQLSSRFVIGAFVDYDFSNISSEVRFGSESADIDLDHMWSAGARLGWLATPDTMWYALVAYTQGEYDLSELGGGDLDVEGWSLGAGVETRLGDNWSLKGEYRFTQFDGETIFSDFSYCSGIDVEAEPSVHTARLVLSYRINPFERSLDSMK
jgi:outer membrane immunogenic protein